jgi:1,4-dihydroxy-2-naphthoate octaprenyltransferase
VETQARVFKNTIIKYLGDRFLISFYFQFLVVVVVVIVIVVVVVVVVVVLVVVYPSCVGFLKEVFKNKLSY